MSSDALALSVDMESGLLKSGCSIGCLSCALSVSMLIFVFVFVAFVENWMGGIARGVVV